ncbi:hypothetical protein D3C81_1505530 [compost metagenome]
MVRPFIEVTTSPGLVARPDGMFSHAAMMPMTFSFRFISPMARKVPSTDAAPPMSYFISSMPGPALSEMPPVSKVMPLPTRTTGASLALPPMCFRTMNFGGCSLPLVTDRKLPIFSASSCLRSSTSTSNLKSLASCLAVLAR